MKMMMALADVRIGCCRKLSEIEPNASKKKMKIWLSKYLYETIETFKVFEYMLIHWIWYPFVFRLFNRFVMAYSFCKSIGSRVQCVCVNISTLLFYVLLAHQHQYGDEDEYKYKTMYTWTCIKIYKYIHICMYMWTRL